MAHIASDVPQRGAFAHPVRNVGALGIREGMSVADFGSGSGAYALAIARELKGTGRVFAVDIQRDLLRRTLREARDRGLGNLEVIWADLEKPVASKLADRTLDLVLISNLLFQVDDKRALLAEARRVLRTGGTLVIIDWQESYGGMGPVKGDVVTKENAFELCAGGGFEFSHEFDAGAHHYGLVFCFAPKKV